MAIQGQIQQECSKYLNATNKRLNNPEPETREYLNFSRQTKSGFKYRRDNPKSNLLQIIVSKQQLQRAIRTFDILIKVLKVRGHHLTFRYEETFAVVYEQEIKLYLREKTKRVPTGKDYPQFDYITTGLFTLQVDRWGGKREYTEGKKNIIEMIPRIVALMEIRADEERQWYIESEKRKKIWKQKEQEHLQLEEKKEKELVDFKNLLISSELWHKAENLRQFIDKMEESFTSSNNTLLEWLQWARKKADWYDPFIEAKDELMAEVDRETLTRNRIPFDRWS